MRLGSNAEKVVITTIDPPPCCSMIGVTSFVTRITGFNIISCALFQSSSEISRRSPFGGPPTWIKTESIRLYDFIVSSKNAFTSSRFSADPRFATPSSSLASCSQLSEGDINDSLYPRPCISRATAAPIPRPPPIIMQILFVIEIPPVIKNVH